MLEGASLELVKNPGALQETTGSTRDRGLIPGSGRSPGEGNGKPLQYSCLENPMDGEAWQATAHGIAKGRTGLRDFTSSLHNASKIEDKKQLFNDFTYLFLAVLCLRCCLDFSLAVSGGYSLVVAAFLAGEHELLGLQASVVAVAGLKSRGSGVEEEETHRTEILACGRTG